MYFSILPKSVTKNLPDVDIQLDGTPIQAVASYKYLGMDLDSKLCFKKHVRRIIASTTGKQFQRMRGFLNKKAAIMVYKSMLLPIMEYGDVFLSAATLADRKKLHILQNKGLRCALNGGIKASSRELHYEAKLLKLKFRREQHVLNYMYDMSMVPIQQKRKTTLTVKTRSHKKRLLRIKKPNTEKLKKSFAYRGPKKWNSLPVALHLVQSKAAYKALVAVRFEGKASREDVDNTQIA